MRTKTLLLARHAQASKISISDDLTRVLTPKGKVQAKLIAQDLKNLNLIPELIIHSPANRSSETASIIINDLKESPIDDLLFYGLYDATVKEYKRIITKVPDTVDVLLLVGHNPILSELAKNLSPEINKNLPPAGVLVFQWNASSWDEFLQKINNPVELLEFN